jgi:hypothetical protein
MAVPSTIVDCSETVASNSPGGSDLIGGSLDNYIRAHAGILRQQSLNLTWVPYGEAVTYVSTTTFTVVEATAGGTRWYAGRMFKATCGSNIVVGIIASTSVSAGTRTVTILSDEAIDNTLSRVDLAAEPQSVLPVENVILNPMFRFWQRNTSFSVAAGATPTKCCDGWLIGAGSATGASTVSRQAHTIGQASIPFEPTYYMRWDQTIGSTGTAPTAVTRVEDVRTFAGQTVCLTVLMKLQSAGTLTSLTPAITQNFGTGGSPSTAVGTSGSSFLPTSSWALYTFALQLPSLNGKTIGTTVDTHSLGVSFVAAPATATFTLDIAGIWLHAGSIPVLTPPKSFEVEYAKVQRRFYKTFTVDQVPAQNVGDANSAATYACVKAGVSTWRGMHPLPVPLRSELRANQTFTFYSPNAATTAWYNVTGAAASGASGAASNAIGRNFITLVNNQAAGDAANDQLSVHFTVDCEYAT